MTQVHASQLYLNDQVLLEFDRYYLYQRFGKVYRKASVYIKAFLDLLLIEVDLKSHSKNIRSLRYSLHKDPFTRDLLYYLLLANNLSSENYRLLNLVFLMKLKLNLEADFNLGLKTSVLDKPPKDTLSSYFLKYKRDLFFKGTPDTKKVFTLLTRYLSKINLKGVVPEIIQKSKIHVDLYWNKHYKTPIGTPIQENQSLLYHRRIEASNFYIPFLEYLQDFIVGFYYFIKRVSSFDIYLILDIKDTLQGIHSLLQVIEKGNLDPWRYRKLLRNTP